MSRQDLVRVTVDLREASAILRALRAELAGLLRAQARADRRAGLADVARRLERIAEVFSAG